MTEQTTTSSTSAPATTTPTRRRGTWLAAAAAAVIVGGGGYAVVSGLDDDNAPGVAQNQLKPAPTVLRLEASAPAAGRCAVPTPEILAQFDVAFAGTVTAVKDDVAVLEPTEVFVGDAVDSVEVTNFADVGAALAMRVDTDVRLLGAPVHFAVGESYLVAATDGVVSPCGFSGPAAGDLQQLYDAAFR